MAKRRQVKNKKRRASQPRPHPIIGNVFSQFNKRVIRQSFGSPRPLYSFMGSNSRSGPQPRRQLPSLRRSTSPLRSYEIPLSRKRASYPSYQNNFTSRISYGKRPSYSSTNQSSYSSPGYSSRRTINYSTQSPSLMDYYKAYSFAKPRLIGTAKDVYNYSQPKLLIAGKFAAKEVKAGYGFAAKEAKAGYEFASQKLSEIGKPQKEKIYSNNYNSMPSIEAKNAIMNSKSTPKMIAPKSMEIPMKVKAIKEDGITVYESDNS